MQNGKSALLTLLININSNTLLNLLTMATQPTNKTKAELALELGRSMSELRNYTRQFIHVKIRDNAINITFEMLEVMGCLWKQDGINQQG
jgi:hypothetical protein